MTLSELLQDVEVTHEFTDVEIKDVTDSTQRMVPGCAFVCIRGERADGNAFAAALNARLPPVLLPRLIWGCPIRFW